MFSVASRFRRLHSLAESRFFSNRRSFFSLRGSPSFPTRAVDADIVAVVAATLLGSCGLPLFDGESEAAVAAVWWWLLLSWFELVLLAVGDGAGRFLLWFALLVLTLTLTLDVATESIITIGFGWNAILVVVVLFDMTTGAEPGAGGGATATATAAASGGSSVTIDGNDTIDVDSNAMGSIVSSCCCI